MLGQSTLSLIGNHANQPFILKPVLMGCSSIGLIWTTY